MHRISVTTRPTEKVHTIATVCLRVCVCVCVWPGQSRAGGPDRQTARVLGQGGPGQARPRRPRPVSRGKRCGEGGKKNSVCPGHRLPGHAFLVAENANYYRHTNVHARPGHASHRGSYGTSPDRLKELDLVSTSARAIPAQCLVYIHST